MDLLDTKSIILQIGDLKLEDTAYTFGQQKTLNEFEYCPLDNQYKQLDYFVKGDAREGVEIKYDNKSLFLAYGANRATSNAQNMAIGFLYNNLYHFIVEYFDDIYSSHPELITRKILLIDNIWKIKNKKEKHIIYYGELLTRPTKKDLELFKKWLELVQLFKPAFSSEKLTQLSPIRSKRFERSNH